MAFIRVEQRNARLAGPVKVEYVTGRDGQVAKGVVTIISNQHDGTGPQARVLRRNADRYRASLSLHIRSGDTRVGSGRSEI